MVTVNTIEESGLQKIAAEFAEIQRELDEAKSELEAFNEAKGSSDGLPAEEIAARQEGLEHRGTILVSKLQQATESLESWVKEQRAELNDLQRIAIDALNESADQKEAEAGAVVHGFFDDPRLFRSIALKHDLPGLLRQIDASHVRRELAKTIERNLSNPTSNLEETTDLLRKATTLL